MTDQLKSKECKGVIAILITAKSKVLKRWKAIDARYIHVYSEGGVGRVIHCRGKSRGVNIENKELTWLCISFSSTQYH